MAHFFLGEGLNRQLVTYMPFIGTIKYSQKIVLILVFICFTKSCLKKLNTVLMRCLKKAWGNWLRLVSFYCVDFLLKNEYFVSHNTKGVT